MVVFDDRATSFSGTTQTVNINGVDVSPTSVAFSNSAASYALQGTNAITGNTGLTVNGAGLVTITNANTYSGATTISSGTLQIGNGSPGQDGTLNGTSGVMNNSTLIYNINGLQTASYAIAGSGVVVMNGPGSLTLAGTNNYPMTSINAGTVIMGNANALGVSGGSLAWARGLLISADLAQQLYFLGGGSI